MCCVIAGAGEIRCCATATSPVFGQPAHDVTLSSEGRISGGTPMSVHGALLIDWVCTKSSDGLVIGLPRRSHPLPVIKRPPRQCGPRSRSNTARGSRRPRRTGEHRRVARLDHAVLGAVQRVGEIGVPLLDDKAKFSAQKASLTLAVIRGQSGTVCAMSRDTSWLRPPDAAAAFGVRNCCAI